MNREHESSRRATIEIESPSSSKKKPRYEIIVIEIIKQPTAVRYNPRSCLRNVRKNVCRFDSDSDFEHGGTRPVFS